MTPQTQQMPGDERHGLSIGILSVTAVVLLVGIVVVSVVQKSAMAIGMSDRGGDYIVVTVQFTQSKEAIVVTDAAAERMAAYMFNETNRRMDPISVYDLKLLKDKVVGGAREERRNTRPERERRRP